MRRPLLTIGAMLLVAAALATAAIGRSESHSGVRGPFAADAMACLDDGGTFHPQAWRAPAEYLEGYHCLVPTSSPAPASDLADAAKRCQNAHHGDFMTFEVADFDGYACTWPRS